MIYQPEVAEQILERLAEGETLRAVCRDLKVSTVVAHDWCEANAEFATRYARAREHQGHAAADRAVERAMQRSDSPQADRLEFDALRWFAGKVAPRHYSDKVQVGSDPDNPLTVVVRRIVDTSGG